MLHDRLYPSSIGRVEEPPSRGSPHHAVSHVVTYDQAVIVASNPTAKSKSYWVKLKQIVTVNNIRSELADFPCQAPNPRSLIKFDRRKSMYRDPELDIIHRVDFALWEAPAEDLVLALWVEKIRGEDLDLVSEALLLPREHDLLVTVPRHLIAGDVCDSQFLHRRESASWRHAMVNRQAPPLVGFTLRDPRAKVHWWRPHR